MKEILHTAAKLALQLGILDQTAYRNKCLRLEFEEMKLTAAGETVETIIQKIAEKHHLGFETIREIVYRSDEMIERIPKPKLIKKPERRIEPRRRQ